MRWSIEELIYGLRVASNNNLKLKYRIIRLPRALWGMIKVFWHWVFKGFCWSTIWDLDSTLIDFFIERLNLYKKMKKSGYPYNVSGQEEWNKIIGRLIHGFEIMQSEEYALNYERPEVTFEKIDDEVTAVIFEATEEEQNRMKAAWKKQANYDKETLRLFAKYFRDLWD